MQAQLQAWPSTHGAQAGLRRQQLTLMETAGVRSSSESVSTLWRWLRVAAGSMGSSSRSMLDLQQSKNKTGSKLSKQPKAGAAGRHRRRACCAARHGMARCASRRACMAAAARPAQQRRRQPPWGLKPAWSLPHLLTTPGDGSGEWGSAWSTGGSRWQPYTPAGAREGGQAGGQQRSARQPAGRHNAACPAPGSTAQGASKRARQSQSPCRQHCSQAGTLRTLHR